MRVAQPKGKKGSLKWIQVAIQNSPQVLQPEAVPTIEWLSPLVEDDYAEYRDESFLDLLGVGHLSPRLKDFWPSRGPQWDALGRTRNGPILVEAKSHIREFFSPPTQAGPSSRAKIEAALSMVRADIGASDRASWIDHYYQYSNRLSFLWWLRKQGIDATLLFVSFVNDCDMDGPSCSETWEAVFAAADYALGLPSRNKLRRHIFHMTPDVQSLRIFDDGIGALENTPNAATQSLPKN